MSFYKLTNFGIKSVEKDKAELVNSKLYNKLLSSHEENLLESVDKDERMSLLEQENNKLKMPIELGDRIYFTRKQLEAHNLEQQSDGLQYFISNTKDALDWDWDMISATDIFEMMRISIGELQEQAKQLKEHKDDD